MVTLLLVVRYVLVRREVIWSVPIWRRFRVDLATLIISTTGITLSEYCYCIL